MTTTTLAEQIERAAATAAFGSPTATKRGRNPQWPYVPVIDHGCYTSQIKGLAYATRTEAIDAAKRHVAQCQADLARKLAEPRHRALREQYGLPREIER